MTTTQDTQQMPQSVERRHHELNLAARECYRLRNLSEGATAADYHDLGDVYFERAIALSEEWDA